MSPQRFDVLRLGLGLETDPWGEEPVTPPRAQRDAVFHDEARVRRLKSLGLTTPLHELEANKGQRCWEGHNLMELGLIGIDAIADRQQLEGGATPDEIKALLSEYGREQCPNTDATAVAAAVVDALVKPRVVRYGEYRVPGAHVEHEWTFALVREVDEGRGVHLRVTIATVNIEGDVLPAIRDARRHILERVQVESDTLEQLRHVAESVSDRAPIEALREVVNDCLRRHQRLHLHLQHAPEEFERLQVEQGFEFGRGVGMPDPEPELLAPVLRLTAADALGVLEVFEGALRPPRAPVSIDLEAFVGWLLRSKRAPPEQLGTEVLEMEFAPEPDPDRFEPGVRVAVETLLSEITTPVELSDLLAGARDQHGALAARLVAMRALAAFAPEEQPDSETLLVASVVGELVDREYAGDELGRRGGSTRSPPQHRINTAFVHEPVWISHVRTSELKVGFAIGNGATPRQRWQRDRQKRERPSRSQSSVG
ncbi:MAG: hypothetical protein ACLP8S_34385 [Solirubrobacteraceae bacterium]